MIIKISTSMRWTDTFPIDIFIDVYEKTDLWFNTNNGVRNTITINNWDEEVDLNKILSGNIDYIIYEAQSFVNRSGEYINVIPYKGTKMIGTMDDVLTEHDNLVKFINLMNTDYLLFFVNKNQIPKFENLTNAKGYFLPITFNIPYTYMSIQTNDWENRYPAIAFSGNLTSKHRSDTASALLQHGIPTTIISHNKLAITANGMLNDFYCGDIPKNFYHYRIMMDNVYKAYSTHIASINTPRNPMENNVLDPGHFVYRIIEIIAGRSLLLQRKIPKDSGFYDVFTPGVDCMEWDSFEELVDKCDFCIRNRESSIEMAKKAFNILTTKLSTKTLRQNIHGFIMYNKKLPDFMEYRHEDY